MARFAHPVFLLILAASIVLAASYGSFMRTAHELAQTGQHSIVICGSEGAETVTLDASGTPVNPQDRQDCAHCADCSLTPIAALPDPILSAYRPDAARPDFTQLSVAQPRATKIWQPSRGPPNQTEV